MLRYYEPWWFQLWLWVCLNRAWLIAPMPESDGAEIRAWVWPPPQGEPVECAECGQPEPRASGVRMDWQPES